jgi:hypothetical protein
MSKKYIDQTAAGKKVFDFPSSFFYVGQLIPSANSSVRKKAFAILPWREPTANPADE